MGVLVVRQEGEKLFARTPGAERVELVPDTTADKIHRPASRRRRISNEMPPVK